MDFGPAGGLQRLAASGSGLPTGTHRPRQSAGGGNPTRNSLRRYTSLPPADASPQRLLALWRGHWGIENRVHWVRDVTFDEDRSQVRTGSAPQIMAALRNLTISVMRLAGETNPPMADRCLAPLRRPPITSLDPDRCSPQIIERPWLRHALAWFPTVAKIQLPTGRGK